MLERKDIEAFFEKLAPGKSEAIKAMLDRLASGHTTSQDAVAMAIKSHADSIMMAEVIGRKRADLEADSPFAIVYDVLQGMVLQISALISAASLQDARAEAFQRQLKNVAEATLEVASGIDRVCKRLDHQFSIIEKMAEIQQLQNKLFSDIAAAVKVDLKERIKNGDSRTTEEAASSPD